MNINCHITKPIIIFGNFKQGRRRRSLQARPRLLLFLQFHLKISSFVRAGEDYYNSGETERKEQKRERGISLVLSLLAKLTDGNSSILLKTSSVASLAKTRGIGIVGKKEK
jgi:hypothetical protein